MTFLGCKFGFGNCFGAASWSIHWAGCHRLSYKIHFYWFLVSWRGLHLLRFFTFALCFKCRMTIVWSMLISSAPSPVVVRGSASMMAPSCSCQLLMSGHCPPHLQGSRVLSKASLTTTTLYVLQQFLGQKCCGCCELSPGLYDPFWTQIRKLLKFTFYLTSFP